MFYTSGSPEHQRLKYNLSKQNVSMLVYMSLTSTLEYTYSFDTGPLWDPNSDRYRSGDTFDLWTRTLIISISDVLEAVSLVSIPSKYRQENISQLFC